MKVFFASLSDPSIEVDAWVPRLDQGITILSSLRAAHMDHSIIMRARIKRLFNREVRYVGEADKADAWLDELTQMEQPQ